MHLGSVQHFLEHLPLKVIKMAVQWLYVCQSELQFINSESTRWTMENSSDHLPAALLGDQTQQVYP